MKNFKFKISKNEYDVSIDEIVENIAHIQVNGTKYEVELEEKQAKPAPIIRKSRPQVAKNEPVQPKSSASSGTLKAINSPLPGNILDIKVGDDNYNFNLPDLRGRVPVHSGDSTGPGLSNRPLGQKSGVQHIGQ